MRLSSLTVPFFAGVLALAPVGPMEAFQQPAPPPPTQGGGTSPGTGGGRTPTPTTPTPGQQQPQFPGQGQERAPQMEMVRPVFISGKVLTTDGAPPEDSATIELVCNGMPRPMAYSNSKGNWSFQVGGGNNMVMPDASVGNPGMAGMDPLGGMDFPTAAGGRGGQMGIRERDLMGCEVRAVLPGYRSESVPLTGRRLLDKPDIGTILLTRLGRVEGYTLSMTTANAPKPAKKAWEKGMNLAKKQKLEEAAVEIQKAVELYPEYAQAWFDLGRIQQALRQGEAARASFRKALAADGKFVNPYLELMQQDLAASDWAQLEETTAQLLKLNPYNYPQAWYYNSVAHLQQNELAEAEKSAREALKADDLKRIPKISHVLGVILAQQQKLPEALVYMKGYLEKAPNAGDAPQVRSQIQQIEQFMGQQAANPAPAPPQQ